MLFFKSRQVKYCPRCKKIKPESAFSYGQGYCKRCAYEYIKNWRQENWYKIKEYNQKYARRLDKALAKNNR